MIHSLRSAWQVDKAIASEQDRLVVVRFGLESDTSNQEENDVKEDVASENPDTPFSSSSASASHRLACLQMDAVMEACESLVSNFAVFYRVDRRVVPDFDALYELAEDVVSVMVFWHGRHMLMDLGTGNNHKITWPLQEKQELIDLLEVVYKGAIKGKGLVVAPRDYSTRHRY